eukprot:Clim_evm16s227 gene=Clim_evmTU16s227
MNVQRSGISAGMDVLLCLYDLKSNHGFKGKLEAAKGMLCSTQSAFDPLNEDQLEALTMAMCHGQVKDFEDATADGIMELVDMVTKRIPQTNSVYLSHSVRLTVYALMKKRLSERKEFGPDFVSSLFRDDIAFQLSEMIHMTMTNIREEFTKHRDMFMDMSGIQQLTEEHGHGNQTNREVSSLTDILVFLRAVERFVSQHSMSASMTEESDISLYDDMLEIAAHSDEAIRIEICAKLLPAIDENGLSAGSVWRSVKAWQGASDLLAADSYALFTSYIKNFLDPSSENCVLRNDRDAFWDMVWKGLRHDSMNVRKRCVFIMQQVFSILEQQSDPDVYATLCTHFPEDLKVLQSKVYQRQWEEYWVIYDQRDSTQVHILKPLVDKFLRMVTKRTRGDQDSLDEFWIHLLLVQFLFHINVRCTAYTAKAMLHPDVQLHKLGSMRGETYLEHILPCLGQGAVYTQSYTADFRDGFGVAFRPFWASLEERVDNVQDIYRQTLRVMIDKEFGPVPATYLLGAMSAGTKDISDLDFTDDMLASLREVCATAYGSRPLRRAIVAFAVTAMLRFNLSKLNSLDLISFFAVVDREDFSWSSPLFIKIREQANMASVHIHSKQSLWEMEMEKTLNGSASDWGGVLSARTIVLAMMFMRDDEVGNMFAKLDPLMSLADVQSSGQEQRFVMLTEVVDRFDVSTIIRLWPKAKSIFSAVWSYLYGGQEPRIDALLATVVSTNVLQVTFAWSEENTIDEFASAWDDFVHRHDADQRDSHNIAWQGLLALMGWNILLACQAYTDDTSRVNRDFERLRKWIFADRLELVLSEDKIFTIPTDWSGGKSGNLTTALQTDFQVQRWSTSARFVAVCESSGPWMDLVTDSLTHLRHEGLLSLQLFLHELLQTDVSANDFERLISGLWNVIRENIGHVDLITYINDFGKVLYSPKFLIRLYVDDDEDKIEAIREIQWKFFKKLLALCETRIGMIALVAASVVQGLIELAKINPGHALRLAHHMISRELITLIEYGPVRKDTTLDMHARSYVRAFDDSQGLGEKYEPLGLDDRWCRIYIVTFVSTLPQSRDVTCFLWKLALALLGEHDPDGIYKIDRCYNNDPEHNRKIRRCQIALVCVLLTRDHLRQLCADTDEFAQQLAPIMTFTEVDAIDPKLGRQLMERLLKRTEYIMEHDNLLSVRHFAEWISTQIILTNPAVGLQALVEPLTRSRLKASYSVGCATIIRQVSDALVYRCLKNSDKTTETFETACRSTSEVIRQFYEAILSQCMMKNFSTRTFAQDVCCRLGSLLSKQDTPFYNHDFATSNVNQMVFKSIVGNEEILKHRLRVRQDHFYNEFLEPECGTLQYIFFEYPTSEECFADDYIPRFYWSDALVRLFGAAEHAPNFRLPISLPDGTLQVRERLHIALRECFREEGRPADLDELNLDQWGAEQALHDIPQAPDELNDGFGHEGTETVRMLKKISPWQFLTELDAATAYARKKDLGRARERQPLILVSSLIDKAPNLGGMVRTCEVFNVSKMMLNSPQITENREFQALSVSAEYWMPLEELKEPALPAWLTSRRQEGYTVVALEQTHSSVMATDYRWPERAILLVGEEKRGIPADLLNYVDDFVEIPQMGMTRSLNVHVSAAIAIWEYSRQRKWGQAVKTH